MERVIIATSTWVTFRFMGGSLSVSPGTISRLLLDWRKGDQTALDKLIPLVYRELRRLAGHYMRRQQPGHSLQTSALINEAYLRLLDHRGMRWQNRAHFYAVAAQAMRRILVDHARSRYCAKRGGGALRVSLDEAAVVAAALTATQSAQLLALDEALTALAEIDPRKVRVVELRYFGGLSVEETAEALSISTATVMREWRSAKGWLLRAIERGD